MSLAAPRTVHECERFRIVHVPGNGDHAVICFNGVNLRFVGNEVMEFRTALSGLEDHFYSVTDKRSHWYNHVFHAIADCLAPDLAAQGIRAVTTLGNSMGGFGALIFAGSLPGCRAAIAFAPPSAKAPDLVPWDRRNRVHADTIADWAPLDAARMLADGIRYTILIGAEDATDRRHARRLAASGNQGLAIYRIAGAGHGVARALKRQRLLYPLIEHLVRTPDDQAGLARLLGVAAPAPAGSQAS